MCDQKYGHCGSRAARAGASEVTEAEALAVVPQLAAMGAGELVRIVGDAYLHPGLFAILWALRDYGVVPVMPTGGHSVDAALAAQLFDAGLARASVSIDAPGAAHLETVAAARQAL